MGRLNDTVIGLKLVLLAALICPVLIVPAAAQSKGPRVEITVPLDIKGLPKGVQQLTVLCVIYHSDHPAGLDWTPWGGPEYIAAVDKVITIDQATGNATVSSVDLVIPELTYGGKPVTAAGVSAGCGLMERKPYVSGNAAGGGSTKLGTLSKSSNTFGPVKLVEK